MTLPEKETFRTKLESEKKQIAAQLVSLKKSDPFEDPDHVMDNASVDTDVREQEAHQRIEAEMKTLLVRLENINTALTRIENGRYGTCKRCNRAIPVKRLELIPESINCVQCEEELKR